VPAVLVSQIMSLVDDHKICPDLFARTHGVEDLIAIDLGRADDQRSICILLPVAGQDADIFGAEFETELRVLRIRKCLEWRCVPRALALAEQTADLFAGPGRPA